MTLSFPAALQLSGRALSRRPLTTLQVNVGKRCNQACTHCHVEAGPKRTEQMERSTFERLLALLAEAPGVGAVDLTGGAPELNPHFRWFVAEVRALGREVIDRCNLTILSEPGQEDLADFLAAQRVRVVASMPCYLKENVDKQRGRGVYDRSVDGLRALNARGYGAGEGLVLDLVYNPGGAFLPGDQAALEADYKRRLLEDHGLRFDHLLTITNMAIARFADQLSRAGRLEAYHQLLVDSFNPGAAENVMCRDLVSVGWDGRLFDCDFNQMLDLPLATPGLAGERTHISALLNDAFATHAIRVAGHCFGCTAGQGSSCGGALKDAAA